MEWLSAVGASFVVGIIIFLFQEYRMDQRIRDERLRRRLEDEIRKHKEEYLSKPLDERVSDSNNRLSGDDVDKHINGNRDGDN